MVVGEEIFNCGGIVMQICIASRSRWDVLPKLIKQLPLSWYNRITVYVPEGQFVRYSKVIPQYIRVSVVPDDWRLTRIRVHMATKARDIGDDTFVFMDDDLRLEMRENKESTKTRTQGKDDVSDMFKCMAGWLKDGQWSHVAIAPRLMQQERPVGGVSDIIEANQRAMCIVGWRVDDFFSIDYGRMMCRQDLDGTLQSLRKGRGNIVLGYWMHNQLSSAGTKGGCADYRTAEMYEETAKQLAAYHPGLVSLYQKKDKTGQFPNRTEVRIAWKKAFNYDLNMLQEAI